MAFLLFNFLQFLKPKTRGQKPKNLTIAGLFHPISTDLTENSKSFNQIKEGVTPIIKRIQKHGIRFIYDSTTFYLFIFENCLATS
jgi:hypothetical protein